MREKKDKAQVNARGERLCVVQTTLGKNEFGALKSVVQLCRDAEAHLNAALAFAPLDVSSD
jgi:hypothetical protein